MSDFPSKVTTETGVQNGHSAQQRLPVNIGIMVNMVFIKSIPACLMVAEIFLGLINWALIAATPAIYLAPYGWVMFVAVTSWIFTILLFFFVLLGVYQNLPDIPWNLMVMVYFGVVTLLYFTAFITNAVYVYNAWHLAAAAFFGIVVTMLYGASTFFAFLDWRSDGENAATSTVPT